MKKLKKKKIIIISLIIIIILAAYFIFQHNTPKEVTLSSITNCNTNSDCTIKYQIYVGPPDSCLAGCFNNKAKTGGSCNEIVWEIFPSETICVCENNICQIKEGFDSKYFQDPLYCESDSDCTFQHICTNCECAKPINVFNMKEVNCAQTNYVCNSSCPSFIPKCINNTCF